MDLATVAAALAIVLVVARLAAQLWLNALNRREVRAHAHQVPEPFKGVMDTATYTRSVQYTLAKSAFLQIEWLWSGLVLLTALFTPAFPSLFRWFTHWGESSVWARAAFIFSAVSAMALVRLPLEWFEHFHLEEKFGFNKMTPKLWLLDGLKSWLLSLLLSVPLIALVLRLAQWSRVWWWLWAWAAFIVFQFLMGVLAPVLILPLFNKFTPLPECDLRQRLLQLAQRTNFRARAIQVMDGSKRSRHSNAFFTGLGRFRKIVLFDTLIAQLDGAEIEAVLAHEIGHYKKKHLPKMLTASAAASLGGCYLVALLARQDWFYHAFGYSAGDLCPALLVCGLLSGPVGYWISPLANWWSRRCEFQADAFAASIMREARPLITALRKLNEANLSNLTPHPLYSAFYYSHPTLLEREQALQTGTGPFPA